MFTWPDRDRVDRAVRAWATQESRQRPALRRLGYHGSYARGDWGVGSDLDLVAIVTDSADPFDRRALAWDLMSLPVPAEILVYTDAEWRRLLDRGGRFATALAQEVVWVVGPDPAVGRE